MMGEIRLSPKPIAVHVHSLGGMVWAGNWLFSLFNQVHVPICTVVDSESASAATFLTVSSPYRVATPFAKSMLHDYWALMGGKREELLDWQDAMERRTQQMKRMYLSRTDFRDDELTELMRHDVWLDAETCVRKGLYDRIVRPDRSSAVRRAVAKLEPDRGGPGADFAPFFKTNWNVLYSRCNSALPMELDALLSMRETTKPVVYTTPGEIQCDDPSVAYACVPRLQSFAIPVFGVVDNDLSWHELIPVLFCHRRFMYDNAHVVSYLPYVEEYGRVEDIVHNVRVDRGLVTAALRQRARPTEEFLADIFERVRHIPAEECLRMGIVDQLIHTGTMPPAQKKEEKKKAKRRT